MRHAYFVSELTLPALCLRALLGRKPRIIAVDPLFPPFRGVLQSLVNTLVKRGMASAYVDECPGLHAIRDYFAAVYPRNIFARTEEWQEGHFRLAPADALVPDYALPSRQAVCNTLRLLYLPVLMMEQAGRDGIVVKGARPHAAGLFDAYVHRRPAQPPIGRVYAGLNHLLALAAIVTGLALIARRTRFKPAAAKEYFFAFDYIADARDSRLYAELAEGGPLLLVPRTPAMAGKAAGEAVGADVQSYRNGSYAPAEAMAAARMVVRDTLRLWRAFKTVEPSAFYPIAALPAKRAVIRAFFHLHRPRFFWGRDDYNAEHHLRRDELGRIGGKSMGITHGFPSLAVIQPMWRYIAFDTYFVIGQAIAVHSGGRWAKDMKIVPCGSFGAKREHYALAAQPKGRDVVVMLSLFAHEPAMAEAIAAMAKALPDRRILVQCKRTFAGKPGVVANLAPLAEKYGNVELDQSSIWDLFARCGYAFSDPSTVINESLEFGLNSFFLDTVPLDDNIYRRYPDICVRSGEEAARRIVDIENGLWEYPRRDLWELVDMSGEPWFDKVRVEAGLPSRHRHDERVR